MNYDQLIEEVYKIWPEVAKNFNKETRKNLKVIQAKLKDCENIDGHVAYKGLVFYTVATGKIFLKKNINKKQFINKIIYDMKKALEKEETKCLKNWKITETLIQLNKPKPIIENKEDKLDFSVYETLAGE